MSSVMAGAERARTSLGKLLVKRKKTNRPSQLSTHAQKVLQQVVVTHYHHV